MMHRFGFAMAAVVLWQAVGGALCAARIEKIVAHENSLEIVLNETKQTLAIAELASYEDVNELQASKIIWTGQPDGEVKIPRFSNKYDRIYSKFILVDPLSCTPVGSARSVTEFSDAAQRSFPLPRPVGKKGLTCVVDIEDAVALGVKYVNDNILLESIIDLNTPTPEATFRYEGIEIGLNMPAIRHFDAKFKRLTEEGVAIFVVFLNRPLRMDRSNPLIHPASDLKGSPTGIFAFNVENETACRYYRAAVEFMVERYTRPDKKYGLISALIVGNELQQHWQWYNMGLADADTVLDNYHRAVRLAWLAAQKHHRDFRIYISMDQHWTFQGDAMRMIRGDELLNNLAAHSRDQGDFPWHIAFHPYPENLFEPRFWLDKVTFEPSTPKITFKNIEVLAEYVKRDTLRFGGMVRDIVLSEQGFHTPDGPDGQRIQAAAYAYSYYKIARIPEISAYMLHRHVDHPDEGGLRLGLWTVDSSGGSYRPDKKKFIWTVFKYADTPQWQSYFEFAKSLIGIENWGDEPTLNAR